MRRIHGAIPLRSGLIVNIAVGAPTGEIIATVIFSRVKLVALRSPEPARGTSYNSAIVLLIQNPMQRRALAGGTIEVHVQLLALHFLIERRLGPSQEHAYEH